jgi:predicted transcriptional regulator
MDTLQTLEGLIAGFKGQVTVFLREYDMAHTTFGTRALSDPNFVKELREGREPHFRTMKRVDKWMKDYRKKNPREAQSAAE